MDTLTRQERSERMSRIRSKGMRPEMLVRKLVHRGGFRFRLHVRNLPGSPDLVFPSRKKVIFVHGCFWHLHGRCALARLPKTRLDFWVPKLQSNKDRDRKNQAKLRRLGWGVLVIWECWLSAPKSLESKIFEFLEGAK
ncbi:MAG: DNA mismatch endonuclease Vsr [SAR324 cluster bacterium]|nr:DNA mismatch endonuclease Vsr [SAR324 cluster bacterium]